MPSVITVLTLLEIQECKAFPVQGRVSVSNTVAQSPSYFYDFNLLPLVGKLRCNYRMLWLCAYLRTVLLP